MNTLVASKLSLALASALMVLTITPAQANSTIVADAIGTPELWEFEEVLGLQKLLSKTNQIDTKCRRGAYHKTLTTLLAP